MYMQRNGSFYTKNYRKQRSRMKLQHRMKTAKVQQHQSIFTKKNARLMIEVEIAIEIHQSCCYATPTLYFFKKKTHTLALTMFWLIRSYQCIAAHDVAIKKFLWTPRRRGYKFNFTSGPINTNGSEYSPRKRRKRLFVFFFPFCISPHSQCQPPVSICMQGVNPNRQWLPIRTFQRCRASFFIFYWFGCDEAAIITKPSGLENPLQNGRT